MLDKLKNKLQQAITEHYSVDVTPDFTRPDTQFGDLATNVAMKVAGQVDTKPRDVAEVLIEALKTIDGVSDVSIAGPGFINIRLSDKALLALADVAPQTAASGLKYVIEYSCPNAFKELHTGHLYQTIVGDILARLLETSGATVYRTSFGGDVGLHVAKCLWGMVAELGGASLDGLDQIEATPFARARWISECYVRGAGQYEQNEETKNEIDELNKQIYGFHSDDDHDSPLAQLYWTTRQWSFDYFDAFYDLIQVDHMRYYPESQTAPTGMHVVQEQLSAGNLTHSNGAIVFEGDESKNLHTRVFVTGKGLPTYETKDIGVIWQEKAEYDFDKRILITGNDQTEYMRVVFAAAEVFRPELAGTMVHLTNGTVRFGDGSKMSSRLGNVSPAADVIEAVREKVRELVKDEANVEAVTLGAVKYVFAKYRLGGDISFDIDETVSLQGNSGPYLQYAHARACSIITKSQSVTDPTRISEQIGDVGLFDDNERALARKLSQYPEVLALAVTDLMPHHLCTYLFELAQQFSRFYESSKVVGDEREAVRVHLVRRYRDTLGHGLGLLGIAAPEKL